MVKHDVSGRTIETPLEATQSENSKDTFRILAISLILAFFIGVGLFWHFGVWPFEPHIIPVQKS
jgi:hypothetical protein